MGEHREGRERDGDPAFPAAAAPENCDGKKRETQRNIEIQEAHREGIAVTEHGDHGTEQPWCASGGGADEGEYAPEENQHGWRHGDFFGGVERDEMAERAEEEIEERIVPARREPEAGRVSVAD